MKSENNFDNKQDQQGPSLDAKQCLRGQQQLLEGATSGEYSTSEKENIASNGTKQRKTTIRVSIQKFRSEDKSHVRPSVCTKKDYDDPSRFSQLDEPNLLGKLDAFGSTKYNKPTVVGGILKQSNLQTNAEIGSSGDTSVRKPRMLEVPQSRSFTVSVGGKRNNITLNPPSLDRVKQPTMQNMQKLTEAFFNGANTSGQSQVLKHSPSKLALSTHTENCHDTNTGIGESSLTTEFLDKYFAVVDRLDKKLTKVQERSAVELGFEVVSMNSASSDGPVQTDGTYLLNRQQQELMEDAMKDTVDENLSESPPDRLLWLIDEAMKEYNY